MSLFPNKHQDFHQQMMDSTRLDSMWWLWTHHRRYDRSPQRLSPQVELECKQMLLSLWEFCILVDQLSYYIAAESSHYICNIATSCRTSALLNWGWVNKCCTIFDFKRFPSTWMEINFFCLSKSCFYYLTHSLCCTFQLQRRLPTICWFFLYSAFFLYKPL